MGTDPDEASSGVRGTGEAPAWGTPGPVAPDLLTLPEFVMRERGGGFGSPGHYELLSASGVPLGTVYQEAGSGNWLFGSATRTFVLADVAERAIATISQPSTWGRTRFLVTAADGREIGTLEQENAFLAPRLALTATDGGTARLTGGGIGSGGVRTLSDEYDQAIGEVSQQFGWGAFFAGTDVYVVRLGDELTGDLRLLSIVATACIDLILNAAEKRNRRNRSF